MKTKSDSENDSARFRRSIRNGKKTTELNEKLKQGGTDEAERSDGARLQNLLQNLNLRFQDCTFTYKLSHFQNEIQSPKKQSRLSTLTGKIFKRLTSDTATTYDRCLFFPMNEKDQVKNFVEENFPDFTLTFINCKFVKRSTTLREKIAIRLRKIFGIMFELAYHTSTASIDHYTFRLKDILFVCNHIQERMIDEA